VRILARLRILVIALPHQENRGERRLCGYAETRVTEQVFGLDGITRSIGADRAGSSQKRLLIHS